MYLEFLFIIPALVAGRTFAPQPDVCNGHWELCHRRYSNITFIGSHNSPFVGQDVADNQNILPAEQLEMGVRFLQGQTHKKNEDIVLCHTECVLRDAGPLENLLSPIKEFLDGHPTEVVTLLLTNPDGFNGTAYDAVFRGLGLDKYAFVPKAPLTIEEWPTLGEMIMSGRRLVVFMDHPKNPFISYILDEFKPYLVETPFEYDEITDLSSCTIHRPSGATAENSMILMNHWLQENISGLLFPDRCQAITTNSEESIMRHAKSCEQTLGRHPNFILLDWIDLGDALRVQDSLNGIPSSQHTKIDPTSKVDNCDSDLDYADDSEKRKKI